MECLDGCEFQIFKNRSFYCNLHECSLGYVHYKHEACALKVLRCRKCEIEYKEYESLEDLNEIPAMVDATET